MTKKAPSAKRKSKAVPNEKTTDQDLVDRIDMDALSDKDIETAKRSEKMPHFKMNDDGVVAIVVPDAEIYWRIFGSGTAAFGNAMANACINVSGRKVGLEEDKNDALAIVAEIAPKDAIETMLATQMASVHIAMMRQSRLLAQSDTFEQLDIYERTFNKLARTFTAQTEALRKHRHGGKQSVTVKHVTVNDGGQAIVGDVSKGGG